MQIGLPQVGREIVFEGTADELLRLAGHARIAAGTGKANSAILDPDTDEVLVRLRFIRTDPKPEPAPRPGFFRRLMGNRR